MRAPICAVLVSLCSCLDPAAITCDFGVCPGAKRCDEVHQTCVFPDQLTSCTGKSDGDDCEVGNRPGVCTDGVCLERGCGDRHLDGAEQCDGDLFINNAADCMDVGFYDAGPISCRNDCTIDTTACHRTCGDGVLDMPQEQCDPGASANIACDTIGFYAGQATCTPQCTYDISSCARCGDGLLQPQELCEPSLGVPDGLSCVALAYDAGKLGCGGSCGGDVSHCSKFNFVGAGSVPFAISDAWVAGPNDVFLVGYSDSGLLARWDGTTATILMDQVSIDHLSGWRSTDGTMVDVWAVGDEARVHFDGHATTVDTLGTFGIDGFAVAEISPNDVYATGFDGVSHFDGASWSVVEPRITERSALFARASDDVWVGGTHRMAHWNGTVWTIAATSFSASGIWSSSPTSVWALDNGAGIQHWDGAAWTAAALPPTQQALVLSSIWGSSESDIFAVGQHVIYRFDGWQWTSISPDGVTPPNVITGSGRTDALIASTGNPARLYRWRGAGRLVTSPGSVAVYNLSCGDASDCFSVVGPDVSHFDGTSWSPVGVDESLGVWARTSASVFEMSRTALFERTGTTWTKVLDAPQDVADKLAAARLVAMNGVSDTDIWLGSDRGDLFHYDGTTIAFVTHTDDFVGFQDIAAADSNNVYAMTFSGIYKWNGASVTEVFESDVRDVFTTPSGQVYAVGDGTSSEVHWARSSGAGWTVEPLPFMAQPVAVSGTSDDDLWVATYDELWHWDGSEWTQVRTSVTGIFSLQVSATDIFLADTVGGFDHIVRACATCL
ncbi:MAG TPA: hypothetical protein VGM90_37535 [Kofleriaceae bacterium]